MKGKADDTTLSYLLVQCWGSFDGNKFRRLHPSVSRGHMRPWTRS